MKKETKQDILSPEKSLIASYIISLLNRGACAKVDRLLKEDYNDIKSDPAILDNILRSQLLAFFSDTGCLDVTRNLVEYYKKYELYSAVLDAKNSMVICSKEDLDSVDQVLSDRMYKVASRLIESDKSKYLRNHVKSAIASCVLVGTLGSKFSSLMSTDVSGDPVLSFIKDSARECHRDLKARIEESKPIEQRDDN